MRLHRGASSAPGAGGGHGAVPATAAAPPREAALALVGVDHDLTHALRAVGELEQPQVGLGDAPVGERTGSKPVDQPVPLPVAQRIAGKWRTVPVWISASASNSSSSVPNPPGAITTADA